MFFHLSNDPDNCVFIKPLLAPKLEIVKVLDNDCNAISTAQSLNTNEQYTYVASLKGNEIVQLKWCFWLYERDKDFKKEYIVEINGTTDKSDTKTNFFLASKAQEDTQKKEENTKALQQNAILSATLTTETHDIEGKQKEVAVLKVKFSKWLDGEKVNVEVYKYKEGEGKPTRDINKNSVVVRMITTSAIITIANFGAHKVVTDAVALVRSSLVRLGLNHIIKVVEEKDPNPENINYNMAQGINAVYLLGDRYKTGDGEVAEGDYYHCMRDVMDKVSTYFVSRIYKLNASNPEKATGWQMDDGEIEKYGAGNTAYIAIDQLRLMLGYKLEKHEVIAIIIFHVMIHNAGIEHDDQDWTAPIAYGRRLEFMAKENFTYNMIIHPEKPDYIFSVWTNILRSYFSKNLLNGSLLNMNSEALKRLDEDGFIKHEGL